MVTSLASLTLEPEHDRGSRLVPGPAEAYAGEGGGDPLGQQVPPQAPASRETRQVRGRGALERGVGTSLLASTAGVGVGVHASWAVPGKAFDTEQVLVVR